MKWHCGKFLVELAHNYQAYGSQNPVHSDTLIPWFLDSLICTVYGVYETDDCFWHSPQTFQTGTPHHGFLPPRGLPARADHLLRHPDPETILHPLISPRPNTALTPTIVPSPEHRRRLSSSLTPTSSSNGQLSWHRNTSPCHHHGPPPKPPRTARTSGSGGGSKFHVYDCDVAAAAAAAKPPMVAAKGASCSTSSLRRPSVPLSSSSHSNSTESVAGVERHRSRVRGVMLIFL